ncbi:MAG: VanW family protein [Patescibacteria group bacterium]
MEKPKNRSRFRTTLGTPYHLIKKYFYWHFSGTNFTSRQSDSVFPELIYSHQTPLLRRLKEVDMQWQHNKITNLKLAIKKINHLIIEPGQTFSFWRQIGCPSARQGYLEGMILQDGKIKQAIGGGLCQLSNLLFWITAHTPLTIIERWRHDYDVFPDCQRSQPFGSGATCCYPNIDLQIKNNTSQIFQLILNVGTNDLVGEWRSNQPAVNHYRIIEKNHLIISEWWGGYTRNNQLYRQVIDPVTGTVFREEFLVDNHAVMMYNPLLK